MANLKHNSLSPTHYKCQHQRASGISVTVLLVACCFTVFLNGCIAAKKAPNLERIFAEVRARKGKRPIIVIPGILGSQLINSKTGEIDWPSVFRTQAEGSKIPLSPDLSANRDDLVPGKIIETVRLGRIIPEVYVYRDLLDALRHYGGYREGDWNNPGPDGDKDTFYVFAYDWRRDNVENARELIRRLVKLKQQLNRADLRFSVISHSMGGLIARYAAMYGDADIPSNAIQPSWSGAAHIEKIVMLGPPNEGSADAFASILYGYSITEGLRRRVPLLNKLTAEDAVTSPALFQLLPHGGAALFLNEELKPIRVDLYDPAVWKEYGWSVINDPEYRKRYVNRFHVSADGEATTALQNLDAYFAAVLSRAKRFHEALDVATSSPPVTLLAVGGDCEETLAAPVLLKDAKKDRWITMIRPQSYRTSSGEKVSKERVTAAMYAPGDGRVTRRSLLGEDLAAQSRSGIGFDSRLALSYAVFGCDLHGQLQRNTTLQDNALTVLVSEAMK